MGDPRIIDITLDEATFPWRSARIDQERRIAIADLVERNHFAPVRSTAEGEAGPYRLAISAPDGRFALTIAAADGRVLATYILGLGRLRRPIRDYLAMCHSHHLAVRQATPHQVEPIDMARRAMHDRGAELLRDRLAGKVEMDFDTARRLFTLVCLLHSAGHDVCP